MKFRVVAALAAACTFAGMQSACADALAYTSYYVLDQKRALDFYVGQLGMVEQACRRGIAFGLKRQPGVLKQGVMPGQHLLRRHAKAFGQHFRALVRLVRGECDGGAKRGRMIETGLILLI